MSEQIVMKDPKVLKVNPINQQIYGNEVIDNEFFDDVRRNGVLEPIIITDKEVIVSGHRRVQAAIECNIKVPCIIRKYASTNDEILALLSFNMYRKKTYSQQMREMDLLISTHKAQGKNKKQTLEALALAQGMSKGHLHRKHKVWEAAQAGEVYAIKLVTKLDENLITMDKGYREVREHENLVKSKLARQKAEASGRVLPATSKLLLGDFVKVLDNIPNGTVDAIITDPPYPAQFLPEWIKLAEFAARKLRPGGWLIAYSGQLHLPKIMQLFSEEKRLVYYWTLGLLHEGTGGTLLVQTVNMNNQWKPILVYQKQHPDIKVGTVVKIANNCGDIISSPRREKEGHAWQQSEGGVTRLLEIFTEEKDLVVDPFAGTATTIFVGTLMKRKCIGAEIVEAEYHKANLRLLKINDKI